MKAELVENMGSDLTVVNAARVSMNKESVVFTYRKDKPKGSDEGLLGYLSNENHWTPYSHPRETFIFSPKHFRGEMSAEQRTGMVCKEIDGKLKVRHSLWGWAKILPNLYTNLAECIARELTLLYPECCKALGIDYTDAVDRDVQYRHIPSDVERDPDYIDLTMREKVPIFVARQRFKHMVGFTYNEVSRRYVDDEPEFFVPDVWRSRPEGSVKQGSGLEILTIDGVKCCENCGEKLSFLRKEDEKMKRFCSKKCQEKYYRCYTDEGWQCRKYIALQKSAEKRDIPFTLSREHFDNLGRPEKCKYLGIPLDYAATKIVEGSPSVNRIDPTKGYEDGNVEIISNKANIVFHTLTHDEFKEMSRNVVMQRDGLFTNYTSGVDDYYEECKRLYGELIDSGMAPEQARMFMPQSQYTEYYVTGSLSAWARAYKQRIDAHAQVEIQDLAKQWGDIIAPLYPKSWEALTNV